MVGVSDEATLHITQVFDVTYFSRSQRSKFLTKLSCFVIIWCTTFLLCVDMYIGTLYRIPESWSDRASNMATWWPS
jgi:hypothetical protein